jgi:hypothetical protein
VWSVLYAFSWFIGLFVAALAYVLLTWAVEGAWGGRRSEGRVAGDGGGLAVVVVEEREGKGD